MPLYEYKCKDCDTVFEVRRPMAEANEATVCAEGHPATRLLSVFASVGGGSSAPAPAVAPRPAGGCGGHCACH
ncbi:MAG: zinc ribbon domain-containing protein [Ilumatobacteraceae bacterium]